MALFDTVMGQVGGNDFVYNALPAPVGVLRSADNMEESISLADFAAAALRPAANVRTVWAMAQIRQGIQEFGNLPGRMGIAVREPAPIIGTDFFSQRVVSGRLVTTMVIGTSHRSIAELAPHSA